MTFSSAWHCPHEIPAVPSLAGFISQAATCSHSWCLCLQGRPVLLAECCGGYARCCMEGLPAGSPPLVQRPLHPVHRHAACHRAPCCAVCSQPDREASASSCCLCSLACPVQDIFDLQEELQQDACQNPRGNNYIACVQGWALRAWRWTSQLLLTRPTPGWCPSPLHRCLATVM